MVFILLHEIVIAGASWIFTDLSARTYVELDDCARAPDHISFTIRSQFVRMNCFIIVSLFSAYYLLLLFGPFLLSHCELCFMALSENMPATKLNENTNSKQQTISSGKNNTAPEPVESVRSLFKIEHCSIVANLRVEHCSWLMLPKIDRIQIVGILWRAQESTVLNWKHSF